MKIVFALFVIFILSSCERFSYKHSHKKKSTFHTTARFTKNSLSRNAKALFKQGDIATNPDPNLGTEAKPQGPKDTLINIARGQDLTTIQMNKAYAAGIDSESEKHTFVMMNYDKYSKFLMSTRGLDYDQPCKLKQGYLLHIYDDKLTMDDQKKEILSGRPNFAVLNKKVLSLFENEHVTALRKLVYLKDVKSTYIPTSWTSLNCLVIVTRDQTESEMKFRTEHLELKTMGFNVTNPDYTVLCAESAQIRDEWLKAIQTIQNCEVRVTENEGTKNVNFELTKIRKKKQSDEMNAQEERDQKMRDKLKEEQDRVKEEWRQRIRKLRMEYYKKKMEERKKKYEMDAQRKKEQELTKKFRDDEECLEQKVQGEIGASELDAQKDVIYNSGKKDQEIFDKLDDNLQKEMDLDRLIADSEREDLALQEKEIQDKLKALMVQETVGFEKIDSPEICYDEDISNDHRDEAIKKVCGSIVGPVISSQKIKLLLKCLDAATFCQTCCEANYGYVRIRERLLCIKKCSSNMGLSVKKNIEVRQSNRLGNYKAILNKVNKDVYTAGDIDKPQEENHSANKNLEAFDEKSLEGKTLKGFAVNWKIAKNYDIEKADLKIGEGLYNNDRYLRIVRYKGQDFLLSTFDDLTGNVGTKLFEGQFDPNTDNMLLENEQTKDKLMTTTRSIIIEKEIPYYIEKKSKKKPKDSFDGLAELNIRKTNSIPALDLAKITGKNYAQDARFKSLNEQSFPNYNLKNMILSKGSSMGTSAINDSSEQSKLHRKNLKNIFAQYKQNNHKKKKIIDGYDISGNKLAECLSETLEEMKVQNLINNQVKNKINSAFEASFSAEIQKRLKSGRIDAKGHLNSYQFVDNVWHFLVQNAELVGEMQEFGMKLDLLQIIAMDLKCMNPDEKAGDASKKKKQGKRKRKSNETEALSKFID